MRAKVIAGAAWAMYVASWFLPAADFRGSGGEVKFGWDAFRSAFSALPGRIDWYWALNWAGLFGNVLMWISPWKLRRPVAPWLVVAFLAAFVVNLVWILVLKDTTLLAGYWLWVGSMGLLAAVAIAGRRRPWSLSLPSPSTLARSVTGVPRIAGVALAAYLLSWFLPTVHVQGVGKDLYFGWNAFSVVLSVMLKPQHIDWAWGVFLAGVLGNVVVLLSPRMFRRDPIPNWFLAAITAAFAVNLAWIWFMKEYTTLLVGYWLWIGSMSLLAAVAIHRRAALTRPAP